MQAEDHAKRVTESQEREAEGTGARLPASDGPASLVSGAVSSEQEQAEPADFSSPESSDEARPAVPDLARAGVRFARVLRACGMSVDAGSVHVFLEALLAVGLDDATTAYWAGRAVFCTRPEDFPRFDRAWGLVFGGEWQGEDFAETLRHIVAVVTDADSDSPETDQGEEDQDNPPVDVITVRWSPQEVLREKSFDRYTEAEFHELRRLASHLRVRGSLKPGRRLVRAKHGGRPDLSRTLRTALKHGGEPVSIAADRPGPRPRRLILLCDVSGSMEVYARGVLRFFHVAVSSRQTERGISRGNVEAFCFGTRLTRVTRELGSRDPDAALQAASAAVVDWGGGTRLGQTFKTFLDDWGRRGMARGADIVILSDGWDRGDPDELAQQMRRLQRLAHRVIWVNPLKGTPGYAPLAQGMAAALPYVDEFLEGHAWMSMENLAKAVSI